jgi:STAS-like domain of unknown function (DUF4325)
MIKTISIASDFSRSPAGRYRTDGPYSGEEFRESVLWPALQSNDSVAVDFTGVRGFGSSFLEEAFGGLVRARGMTLEQVRSRVQIKSPLQIYERRVWKYVADAARH